MTAVVGASGSGKSTLAELLLRFGDPTVGRITLGGTDLRDILPSVLAEKIGFVFQETGLFRASFQENLCLAKPEVTSQELMEVIEKTQLSNVAAKLPQGLSTILGEQSGLSGGEIQRLAMARAFLADTPILVLDEATAFVDPVNESLLQKALLALTKDRTLLVIAHRLKTVTKAASILVLDKGRLIEQGTHESLLSLRGAYYRMWQEETGFGSEADPGERDGRDA
jgi:ATP-binding cassette subfamily B protein